MSNIEVYVPAADGSAYWIDEKGESCKNAIHTLFTDDFAAPPPQMVVEITTASGRLVKVSIPYSNTGTAVVRVDDEVL